MTKQCKCDWATGECQGPLGCKAVAEIARLRAFKWAWDRLSADLRQFVAAEAPEEIRCVLDGEEP